MVMDAKVEFIGIGRPLPMPSLKDHHIPESDYFSLGTLRNTTMETVMRSTIAKHDEGWAPTVTEAEGLICRWGQWKRRDSLNVSNSSLSEMRKANADSDALPWPDACKKVSDRMIDDQKKLIPKRQDETEQFLVKGHRTFGNVPAWSESDDVDGYRFVIHDLIKTMPAENQLKVATYMIQNSAAFERLTNHDLIDMWDYFSMGFDHLTLQDRITQDSALSSGLGDALVQLYDLPKGAKETKASRNALQTFMHADQLFFRALSSGIYPQEKIVSVMSVRMQEQSIGRELTSLRSFLANESMSTANEREIMAESLRTIMGLSKEAPVARTLEEFYASLKFEEYPLSKAIESYRPKWLKRIFDANGVRQDATIIDMACGTGWMTEGLHAQGYDSVQGMDHNPHQLATAKELYPDIADAFIQGDYHTPAIPDASADVICLLGRTSHHDDLDQMLQVLREAKKRLKPEGLFIFDRGDPTQGTYKLQLDQFHDMLQKFGIPEAFLAKDYRTVDSPDGVHFMDRDVSPEAALLGKIIDAGFTPTVYYEENFNGHGDRNMVFVCKNVEPHMDVSSFDWYVGQGEKIIRATTRHDASVIYPFTPPT